MDVDQLEARLVKRLETIDWTADPDRGARLAALMRRLDVQKREIAEIAADFERLSDPGEVAADIPGRVLPSQRTAMRGSRKTMLDWCIELLRTEELHYEEVTRRMLAGGYETRGNTPARSVVAELGRHPDLFEQLGRGFYRLRRA